MLAIFSSFFSSHIRARAQTHTSTLVTDTDIRAEPLTQHLIQKYTQLRFVPVSLLTVRNVYQNVENCKTKPTNPNSLTISCRSFIGCSQIMAGDVSRTVCESLRLHKLIVKHKRNEIFASLMWNCKLGEFCFAVKKKIRKNTSE